jgi:GT2 family glycosyltransferase
MVFGRVVAAEHDPALGFVPETGYERDEIVRSPRDFRPVGLGAAVGLRRSRVLDIGGFDPMLGPGARFRAFDDQDIALRLLLAGIPVVYSRSPAVVHHGFRTYEQGRSLIRGYTLGGSAAYGKYLKCGRPIGLWFITRQITRDVLGDGLRAVRLRQKPPVLGRLRSIISGTVQGIMAPVDRSTLTFVDPQESDPELYA